MARRDDIVTFANELLEVERFPEFGPSGLQVVGADEVTKVACGVSASLELFERAAALRIASLAEELFRRSSRPCPLWRGRASSSRRP